MASEIDSQREEKFQIDLMVKIFSLFYKINILPLLEIQLGDFFFFVILSCRLLLHQDHLQKGTLRLILWL